MKQSRYFVSNLRCIIVGAAQENTVSENGFECSLSHLKFTREMLRHLGRGVKDIEK